jgi:hypothetical protein
MVPISISPYNREPDKDILNTIFQIIPERRNLIYGMKVSIPLKMEYPIVMTFWTGLSEEVNLAT